MSTENNLVTQHYGSSGIADRILNALREVNGPEAPVTPDVLAAIDHYHTGGVAATGALVTLLDPQPGERVVDIGCGIGGPARWIAARCGCQVTGVDLTSEFCEAARALNAACGLSDQVTILEGSALDLPVSDGSFDRAYSQNVSMNIADKSRFYREAFRALRSGGVLALSNLCAGDAGPPYFPAPWAATPETSFLDTADEMRADLAAAGFEVVSVVEASEAQRRNAARELERFAGQALPRVGPHLLMGERVHELRRNALRSLADGRTRPVEALVRKS